MDLTTTYLNLKLKNPLVAGASPLSRDVGNVRALEDGGVAAIVVHSLFEESIEHDFAAHNHFEEFGTESFPEATSYMPALDYSPKGPEEYVEHVAAVKAAVEIPVIPSLNGHTTGGWLSYARILEQAGADALELNVYDIATDPTVSGHAIESRAIDILKAVKESVSIPVSMKLGPYFSSLAHFASRLDRNGADGLVLFNRFYQPDIDLEALEVVPDLVLSASHEIRLPLRWIAILDPIVEASLAATTGIYTASDVLKLLMVGADVTMLCAALLKNGTDAAASILRDMSYWMEEHEYRSVAELKGSMSHKNCTDPSAFERANYMKALHTFE